jgi:hypothetical protein
VNIVKIFDAKEIPGVKIIIKNRAMEMYASTW